MVIRRNYQTMLTLDTATPISEGKMRADCGDLRIYSDGYYSTELSFYIDPTTIDTGETVIYVKQNLPVGRYHPGIAHYWPFDGNANDALSGGINGSAGNTPTEVLGQVGSAYAMQRSEPDYLSFTGVTAEFNNKSQVSQEFWVRFLTLSSTLGAQQTLCQWRGASAAVNKNNIILDTTNRIGMIIATDGSDSIDGYTSSGLITATNRWYHVATTTNLITGTFRIYLDGTQVHETTGAAWNNSYWSNDETSALISNSNTSTALDGYIDNWAIYWRELSADEVYSSYLRGLSGKRLQEPTPTAHWTFKSPDNAGTSVVDVINGLHGAISGGVTIGQPSRVGQSFSFNGTSGVVLVADDPLFESHVGTDGTSTWAATININSTIASRSAIISKYDGGSSATEFLFDVNTDGTLRLFITDASASNWESYSTTAVIPFDNDIHVACSFENNNGTPFVKLYIDGVSVAVTNSSGGTYTQMVSTSTQVGLGARDDATYYLDGSLTEVMWSNSVLTDTQIGELARRSREGLRLDITDDNLDLLAYWTFDNKDIGVDPQDIIGSNHGTNTNGVLVGRDGYGDGEHFTFDGSSNFIHITGSASDAAFGFHTGAAGVMSLAAGIRTRGLGTRQTIISKRNGTTGNYREFYLTVETTGEIRLLCQNGAGTQSLSETTDDPIVGDRLYHVAAVYDNNLVSGEKIKIYIDGVAVASTTSDTSYSQMTTLSENVAIGASQPSGSTTEYFSGDIYSPMYFGEALTPSQVRDMYEKFVAGSGVLSSNTMLYITYGNSTKNSASNASNTFVRELTGITHAYDFNEETGGTLVDLIGSDDGTVVGSALVGNGITGLSRNLNSKSVIDFTTQNIPTGAASIIIRFRTSVANQILWSNYDGYADNAGMSMEITSGGALRIRHSIGTGADNAVATGTTLVNDGVSHTVVITKDDSTLNVYLDGYSVEATDSMIGADVASSATLRLGGYKEDISFVPPSGLVLNLQSDGYIAVGANSLVGFWEDDSSSANDASQSTLANRPVYYPKGPEGLPSIYFPTDTWLSLSSALDLTSSDFTVFAVANLAVEGNTSSSPGIALVSYRGGAEEYFIRLGGSPTGTLTNEVFTSIYFDGGTTAYGAAITSITIPAGVPSVFTTGLSGNVTEDFRINGTDQGTPTETTNGGLDASVGRGLIVDEIGGDSGGTPSLQGHLYALMIFDNRLSTEDTNEVERYLALKYGAVNDSVVGQTRADAIFDEIRVFNTVLTVNEIEDVMNNFAQVVGTNLQVRKRNDPEPSLRVASATMI